MNQQQFGKEDLRDVHQRITDFVLAKLEAGEIIWRKGWNSCGMPKNYFTGRHYQGWNMFLLNFITVERSYHTPFFITYKQAQAMGGTIRKGEKGYMAVWWSSIGKKKTRTTEDDKEEEATVSQNSTCRIPRIHTVFNIDQTEGIDFPKSDAVCRTHTEKIDACEDVVNNMPDRPELRFGGDHAFYHPIEDFIQLPKPERFYSDEAYYSTLFHEMAHSTGHTKRLKRKELVESDGFGKEKYSKEELTAELTAAFLCGICGIEQATIENTSAYIHSWLKALKNDKKLVLKAASQAHQAAEYILGIQSSTVLQNQNSLTTRV